MPATAWNAAVSCLRPVMAAGALAEEDGADMNARIILPALALFALVAAAIRLVRDGGRIAPASRTWLLVGVIFAAVSGWLWLH